MYLFLTFIYPSYRKVYRDMRDHTSEMKLEKISNTFFLKVKERKRGTEQALLVFVELQAAEKHGSL